MCERLIRDYRGALAARRPEDFLAHIYERAAEELYVLELRVASLRREAVRAAGERGSLPGCAVSRAA